MGQYPDEKYMHLRQVADTENSKKIRLKADEPIVTEYLNQLRRLQQEAKDKGMAR